MVLPLLLGYAFENGDTDRLSLEVPTPSSITYLWVQKDNVCPGPDWDPDCIEVNTKRAGFRRWIEENTQAVLGSCGNKGYCFVFPAKILEGLPCAYFEGG
ncbi:hypothetical protein DIPPA_21455 [Diplonema papillatum]|nr:hypothetical protein DIPPA_17952 [Diplonema papillatum]KAJ9444470.1 hypothetical protein DIPPA_21455 [Diplonema papillatum]